MKIDGIARLYDLHEWARKVFQSAENAPKTVSPHPPTSSDWRDQERTDLDKQPSGESETQ